MFQELIVQGSIVTHPCKASHAIRIVGTDAFSLLQLQITMFNNHVLIELF